MYGEMVVMLPEPPEEEPEVELEVEELDELLEEEDELELLEDEELELLDDELEFAFVLLFEPLLQAESTAAAIISPSRAGLKLHTLKSLIYYLSYYHINLQVSGYQ